MSARQGHPLVVLVEPTPGLRGPQRTMLEFIDALADRWDLFYAVPDGFQLSYVKRRHPQVRTLELPFFKGRTRSWAAGSAKLVRELRRETAPTIFHVNGPSGLNLAAPAARILGAPVLVHYHAYEMTRRHKLFIPTWLRTRVRVEFLPVSDFSRGLLEATAARGSVRGILPNPVAMNGHLIRDRNLDRPLRIGWVGSPSPRKGLHLVAEIAERLEGEAIEWHLYGVDEASTDEYVERQRASLDGRAAVMWFGVVEDMAAAYDSMDVLLVPSLLESFCRVAVEGMAAGVPVVATQCPGLSEVVWDGVSGLLFDPRHPVEGAEHLRRLAKDPHLYNEIAVGARRAASRFEISGIVERLEAHYREALK